VGLRPWALRATTPAELDRIAGEAGLTLASRHGGWDDEPLDDGTTRHVSVYRPVGDPDHELPTATEAAGSPSMRVV
jgi:hypothetical protein